MTDKPITFSAPMVRALLDGRKVQTRRALKPQPVPHTQPFLTSRYIVNIDDCGTLKTKPLPYAPGDRLWVREVSRAVEHEDGTDAVEYLADGACTRIANTMQSADQWGALYHYGKKGPDRAHREGQKVPSIHMPRWASRLTLAVTDVRVQRLQEISEADAWAEGCKPDPECADDHGNPFPAEEPHPKCGTIAWDCARDWFADLWNGMHGPDAWGENPWVVALTFDVHRCNIDQMEAS